MGDLYRHICPDCGRNHPQLEWCDHYAWMPIDPEWQQRQHFGHSVPAVRPSLVVTMSGRPVRDQGLGVRLFKDAARTTGPCYRIAYDRLMQRYRLYHGGRVVVDDHRIELGMVSVADVLNWLAAYHQGQGQLQV